MERAECDDGYKQDKGNQVTSNSADYANDLNRLYAHFDCHDFSCELEGIRDRLVKSPTQRNGEITVSDAEVLKLFRKKQRQIKQ